MKDIDLKQLEIDKEHLQNVVNNMEFNKLIEEYYNRLYVESKKGAKLKRTKDGISIKSERDETLKKKRDRLRYCNSVWFIDKYEISKIKDFKKTNLCRDRFCNNCKKVKQASMMAKFNPLLKPYKKDMFQLTLTVPNVKGEQLEDTLKRLFESFTRLSLYLSGRKKIKNVDFSNFNYIGAIRSFEVTYKKTDEYHPHLHCLLVLPGYIGIKEFENRFSYDYKIKDPVEREKQKRLFTKEEVLIQKVWYLLNNKITVTKENIDNLAQLVDKKKYADGYSCRMDKFKEEDFLELFKYMTKSTTEDAKPMRYSHFKTLYSALRSKRQIQGYGVFYNVKDTDEIDPEIVEEVYNQLVKEWREKEKPKEVCETPLSLKEDNEYLLVSRKKIHKYVKENLKDN